MVKDLIRKHNDVVEARYGMNKTQAKIVALVLSKVSASDEPDKLYELSLSELLKITGENNGTALKRATKDLLRKVLEITLPDGDFLQTNFFTTIKYKKDDSCVLFQIPIDLKPYYLNIFKNGNYTKYTLENIMQLNSYYSIRIYELCKRFSDNGWRQDTIESLKTLMEIKKGAYPRYNNFKTKILEVARKEINAKTDLLIRYRELKTGRSVTSIKFYIKDNPNFGKSKHVVQTGNISDKAKKSADKTLIEDELFQATFSRIESKFKNEDKQIQEHFLHLGRQDLFLKEESAKYERTIVLYAEKYHSEDHKILLGLE